MFQKGQVMLKWKDYRGAQTNKILACATVSYVVTLYALVMPVPSFYFSRTIADFENRNYNKIQY